MPPFDSAHSEDLSSNRTLDVKQARWGWTSRSGDAERTVIVAVDCAPLAAALAQMNRPENRHRITTVSAGDNAIVK
jgi:hypothetical protein